MVFVIEPEIEAVEHERADDVYRDVAEEVLSANHRYKAEYQSTKEAHDLPQPVDSV
eukprot:CAMPEP_0118934660 /NCGR_PEP_ID=MMETSP1169-20130426/13949_1 /TAXON_ID=36882 /ORGANISM="Pyramimonas obovata, Strain CCMP722" /LENGTH=55 /DNA_ID=CAMNT_0006877587 /DNA_START=316 /DNA_END=483 /DNA_ORIENTATION=+